MKNTRNDYIKNYIKTFKYIYLMIVTPVCICVTIFFIVLIGINSMVIVFGNIENNPETIKIGIILMVLSVFLCFIISMLCLSFKKPIQTSIPLPENTTTDLEVQNRGIVQRSDSAREYTT